MTATPPPPPRWHATPLDPAAARSRAGQLIVLADPERLRVLSMIAARAASSDTLTDLTAALRLPTEAVSEHVMALRSAGLVSEALEDRRHYVPTADTWVRYGRLLAGSSNLGAESRSTRPVIETPQGSSDLSDAAIDELPPVLQRVVARLAHRFSTTFSRETVERYVADSYQLLSQRAKVPHHLVSLTTRFSEDRLGALAAAGGRELRGTPEVLFVCVRNAGRSQLAAAILRQLAGRQVHIRTAGSRPTAAIDPTVVAVLDEIGVPVASEFPKPLTDEVVQASDYVITMGCGDACPVYPGRRYMDWPLTDPLGRPIDEVRVIRDQVRERVTALCREMDIDVPTD